MQKYKHTGILFSELHTESKKLGTLRNSEEVGVILMTQRQLRPYREGK